MDDGIIIARKGAKKFFGMVRDSVLTRTRRFRAATLRPEHAKRCAIPRFGGRTHEPCVPTLRCNYMKRGIALILRAPGDAKQPDILAGFPEPGREAN
ncbi:MAG: hypothetical protein K2K45_05770 [Muribaculaceae bacterium]|nr:hypothetical protein [Muribaculaceae bacterium]